MSKNDNNNVNIPNNLMKIHKDLVNFGVMIQEESLEKFEKKHHIYGAVIDSFYRINAYAITLHKAALCLCKEGWTHISPILLRSIMECSVNCLAIINYKQSEYMAFKYLFYDDITQSRDNYYTKSIREDSKNRIELGLNKLENKLAKQEARDFIRKGQFKTFWFQPEFNFITGIIEKYGSPELKYAYKVLSLCVHAADLGTVLFKDDPKEITIEPGRNPQRTKEAILLSCKLILDLFIIRNDYESLKCDLVYQNIYDDLLVIKSD